MTDTGMDHKFDDNDAPACCQVDAHEEADRNGLSSGGSSTDDAAIRTIYEETTIFKVAARLRAETTEPWRRRP